MSHIEYLQDSGLTNTLKQYPRLYSACKGLYSRASQLGNTARWRKLASSQTIKLNLGSGPETGKDGWTTVDIYGADINHDLRKGIPLPNNCVEMIYSSHLLEHIPFQGLLKLLGECHRVIKPGGHISVCVPNAGNYIRAYMRKENFRTGQPMYEPGVVDTGSYMDQLNYVAYLGDEHKYMFDEENLINLLTKCGFKDAVLREFDPEIDLEYRAFESVYALAEK